MGISPIHGTHNMRLILSAWNSHTELISAAARTAPMEHMSGTHTLNTRFNVAARTTSIELMH
jgi:hypothetical protein